MPAKISLPAPPDSKTVSVNGKPVKASLENTRWILDEEISGKAEIKIR